MPKQQNVKTIAQHADNISADLSRDARNQTHAFGVMQPSPRGIQLHETRYPSTLDIDILSSISPSMMCSPSPPRTFSVTPKPKKLSGADLEFWPGGAQRFKALFTQDAKHLATGIRQGTHLGQW